MVTTNCGSSVAASTSSNDDVMVVQATIHLTSLGRVISKVASTLGKSAFASDERTRFPVNILSGPAAGVVYQCVVVPAAAKPPMIRFAIMIIDALMTHLN